MALLSSPLDATRSFLASLPPVTRAVAGLLIFGSLLYQYLGHSVLGGIGLDSSKNGALVLIPGYWIWYPWTIVTSAFVESNFIELVFTLIFVVPSLRYLERLWGTLETVKFILVTCGISNVISIVINYVESFVLGNPELFLYGMPYSGMMALQVGCLVAFTQLIPEHQVQLFGVIKLRVKQLPMLYVGFSNVMCIIGFQSPYILIQWGWLVSWIYLRFYKKTSTDVTLAGATETWGDRSETFAFIYWFPPFVHGPLGKVTDLVYTIAVRVKVVRPYPSGDLESGGYASLGGGNARAEAERRRAMALKALDQRLATSAAAASSSKPPQASDPTDGDIGTSSSAPRPPQPSQAKVDSGPSKDTE